MTTKLTTTTNMQTETKKVKIIFVGKGKNHICNYSPLYLEKTEPLKYGSKRRPKEKYAWQHTVKA